MINTADVAVQLLGRIQSVVPCAIGSLDEARQRNTTLLRPLTTNAEVVFSIDHELLRDRAGWICTNKMRPNTISYVWGGVYSNVGVTQTLPQAPRTNSMLHRLQPLVELAFAHDKLREKVATCCKQP